MKLGALACGLLALAPLAAGAEPFRLPLHDCDTPSGCQPPTLNRCYVTAYYDHEGKDWNCGTTYRYDGHVGTDIGVGGVHGVRAVVAADSGVVTERNDGCDDHNTSLTNCSCGGGFGNFVKLRHDDGQVSIYGHMAKGSVAVSVGQSVDCGQLLGRVSSSGCSTGPHAHFEVVDPTYGSDDPFAGSCGGPLAYWEDQGPYCGLPGTGYCATLAFDDAYFLEETILDDTHFAPGTTFTKTWTMQNSGTSAWTRQTGYRWVFDHGEGFGAAETTELGASETVRSGQTKVWSVSMVAPTAPGTYRGHWRMEQAASGMFGAEVWVQIIVDPTNPTENDRDGDGHRSLASGGDDCDDDDAQVFPGRQEVCDGKDNDCSGEADEELTRECAEPCPGIATCAGGSWGACAAGEPELEECNGRDDDCDGRIDDEAACDEGMSCRSGLCLPDTGEPDAGEPGDDEDAGEEPARSDAGSGASGRPIDGGCGCASSSAAPLAGIGAIALLGLARRLRRREGD